MNEAAATSSPEERSAALMDRIRAEIESSGRITFARFMSRALYEPELGYYRGQEDRPTATGDFLTAPEMHPLFGRTLSRQIEEMWQRLDRPARLRLVEFGAGSGSLGLAICDGLRRRGSPLSDALEYEPIETNPFRAAELADRFAATGLLDRLIALRAAAAATPAEPDPSVGPRIAIVLANEFLDALPVHRVVQAGGALQELYVTWRDGFVEEPGEPSTPELAGRLALDEVRLADRQQAEICLGLEPWLDDVAGRLGQGYVLIVDYGYRAAELYGPRHMAGTLQAYAGHRLAPDPLAAVGRQDLTAHVDFTALERLARSRGLVPLGLVAQRDFLVGSGLEAELRAVQAAPDATLADYAWARSAVVRLLDPRATGGFRVLVLGRGIPPEPLSGLSLPAR